MCKSIKICLFAWAGVVVFLSSAPTAAQTNAAVIPLDWSNDVAAQALPDGSVLTAYRASSRTSTGLLATFSVTFYPRFRCEPLAAVTVNGSSSPVSGSDRQSLTIIVDGDLIQWPVIADESDAGTVFTHKALLGQRRAFLDLIDRSNRALVRIAEDTELQFSLLGSARAAAEAQERCRAHQPSEWVPTQ